MILWHASEPQRLTPRGRTCLPFGTSYRAIDEQLNPQRAAVAHLA